MRRIIVAVLTLSLTAACDVVPTRTRDSVAVLPQALPDIRLVPAAADLRVGDRVTFSASYPGVAPVWSWSVTDTLVATIHPDSATLRALRPGTTNVIVASKERPSLRAVAPIRVR